MGLIARRVLASFAAAGLSAAAARACAPKADEEAVLFPTDAALRADGAWEAPLHAWVFEPERKSVSRRALRAAFQKSQGWSGPIPEDRIATLLVDNERGKALALVAGEGRFSVGPTGDDGHARGAAVLPAGADGRFRVEGCPGDGRVFEGRAFLIPPQGVSVVSDVDDTIKVSQVLDRRALLDNTFAHPFRPVPGMADLYRRWAAGGAAFHYLSASPWQLYPALEAFRRDSGFPEGSFALKSFRWKDQTLLNLFQDPVAYKTPLLENLLVRYPRRTFVLVGDDGEKDPEIFGDVARRFPGRVAAVYIRLSGAPEAPGRFAQAFAGLPPEIWKAFKDPMELPERLRP